MSDCGRLSDRMPGVALGRFTWTEEESSHLLACTPCREEWDLVRVTAGLGMEVGAGVDARSLSQAVLQRLERDQKTAVRRRSWSFAALAGAAAAAVIVWAGTSTGVKPPPAPIQSVASLQIQLPELEELQPAELNAVLQTMDEPYVGGAANDSVAADSDDEEIEYGFETWEG